MQLPSPDPDTLFEEILQDLPPETEEMARDFKAFTRARKIKTPAQLLRVVFLYSGLDKSLREAAGDFTLLEERITDSSVAERLAACLPWVKALLPRMLQRPDLFSLPEEQRFLVIDGSCIQGPGAQGTQYRLHLCMDLITLEFTYIAITDKHTGESLKNFPLKHGDVAVVDRGYSHPGTIVETVSAGADLILRLNPHSVPLFHLDGSSLDLVKSLKDQPYATVLTLPVLVGPSSSTDRVQGWVHAYRLPEEQANKARQDCRKRNKKKGGSPKETTLFLAGWVLVFTSLSPGQLSAQAVLGVYRVRWQIEIAIKRWKSLLDVGALRAREGSPLAEVWLHGKLLYALMLEKRMRRTMGDAWSRLDQERAATWWRPWKMMQDEIAPLITAAMFRQPQAWEACLEVLMERPRRRKLQRLPQEAVEMASSSSIRYQYCMPKAS